MTDRIIAQVRNAKKRYKKRDSLICSQLQIYENDCLAIVGENGSGKSTLLRVVAGITSLDEGTITLSASWKSSEIAYLPQSGGLYGNLTVDENLSVYRRLSGGESRHGLSEELWNSADLNHYAKVKVRHLSGGYQKLVALSAVLSINAQILILDEPSAELHSTHSDLFAAILSKASPHYLGIIFAEHAPNVIQAGTREVRLPLK
jgi:ABC-type multidrug transport system ATPase subunit